MLERQLSHIKPDMDVCDVTGDKVGHIAHVYRHTPVAVSASDAANSSAIEGGRWKME